MTKKVFVTATGTDKGKTYVSALIAKKVKQLNKNIGYYKVALSGADDIASSDAGYVKQIASLDQDYDSMISYLFSESLSPHLAAKRSGVQIKMERAVNDFESVCEQFDYVLVEGSGGIVCPISYENEKIMLIDVVKQFDLGVVIVCSAGLGTINETVLTTAYLQNNGVKIEGIIMNEYDENDAMHIDNAFMIQELTKQKIIAYVKKGDVDLQIADEKLLGIFA